MLLNDRSIDILNFLQLLVVVAASGLGLNFFKRVPLKSKRDCFPVVVQRMRGNLLNRHVASVVNGVIIYTAADILEFQSVLSVN